MAAVAAVKAMLRGKRDGFTGQHEAADPWCNSIAGGRGQTLDWNGYLALPLHLN